MVILKNYINISYVSIIIFKIIVYKFSDTTAEINHTFPPEKVA